MEFRHRSVLLEETIEGLNIRPDGIYLDGTLGGGGHSSEILRRLQNGRLIGIDQDEEALAAAGKRLSEYTDAGGQVTLIRDNYCNAAEAVRRFHPYALDISSGIETDGVKDPGKMAAFAAAVRKAEGSGTG